MKPGRGSRTGARKRLQHELEYALLRLVLLGLRAMPMRGALWVARRLGDLAYDGVRIRRRVTRENLRRALGPQRTQRELDRIARSCYRHFAMTFVELALCSHRPLAELDERVEVTGWENVTEAAARGRGILFLTAHFGNWEILGAWMGRGPQALHVVVGDQRNRKVDQYSKHLRRRLGMEVIPMGAALRDIVRTLRGGGQVALVADQDGGPEGLFLDFFGRPASFPLGPARFAYRTGAPIVMGFGRRVAPGRFRCQFPRPIYADPSRPESEEIARILRTYSTTLESLVQRDPEQWFWMHRRWKTRPQDPQGGEELRAIDEERTATE